MSKRWKLNQRLRLDTICKMWGKSFSLIKDNLDNEMLNDFKIYLLIFFKFTVSIENSKFQE